MNDRLVDRGDLDIWIDRAVLAGGRTSRRGRPYEAAVVELACVVAALFRLPLRQTEGFLRHLRRVVGGSFDVPDYSTICRRRRSIVWPRTPVPERCVLVVDATGVTVCSPGDWLKLRTTDVRRARFVKLHCGIDAATGRLLAHVVTPADGQGTGDVSVGPHLIRAAAEQTTLDGVLGDMAYGSRGCYQAARDAGTRLTVPPKSRAVTGGDIDRDITLTQIARIGDKAWRQRTGYGQRAQIEAWFGAIKRSLGDRVRASSFDGARAEIEARVHLYDRFLAA